MKTARIIVIIILLIIGGLAIAGAQININVGFDPKIAVLGTDNQFTKHDPLFNFEIKVEIYDDERHYFALGHKYVNLSSYYRSYYINIGKEIKVAKNVLFIPNLELGLLVRDMNTQKAVAGVIYPQINTDVRYDFKHFQLSWKPYLQYSRDIGKAFRYGSNIALIIKI